MFHLLLLPPFLLFNFFLLRWLARQLVVESAWLRDPEMRKEILQRHALDRLGDFLVPFGRQRWYSDNPVFHLLGILGLIGFVLWLDYVTIRQQWPWLLGG